jgi:hypothetical protein
MHRLNFADKHLSMPPVFSDTISAILYPFHHHVFHLWLLRIKCTIFPRARIAQLVFCFYYGLDDRGIGVRVPIGPRIFPTTSRPALRSTQSPMQWVQEEKLPGREADHSSPTSAEVKKTWIYINPLPHTSLWRSA